MKSDEGNRATGALQTKSDGSNRAAGATLGMYFSAFSLSSFLSLMKEKRAKENQGARGTCQFCRVQEGAGVVFLDEGNRATGALKMESNGSNRATRATLGKSFSAFFLSSFLSLMEEKRAKENQAPTGGGEVGRVQEGAGVVFSEICRVREGAGVVFSEVGRVQDRAGVVFSEVGWVRDRACAVFSGGGG